MFANLGFLPTAHMAPVSCHKGGCQFSCPCMRMGLRQAIGDSKLWHIYRCPEHGEFALPINQVASRMRSFSSLSATPALPVIAPAGAPMPPLLYALPIVPGVIPIPPPFCSTPACGGEAVKTISYRAGEYYRCCACWERAHATPPSNPAVLAHYNATAAPHTVKVKAPRVRRPKPSLAHRELFPRVKCYNCTEPAVKEACFLSPEGRRVGKTPLCSNCHRSWAASVGAKHRKQGF